MINPTIFQYFHWYYPEDGSLWKRIEKEAAHLSETGVTHLWLPPAYKSASGAKGVGYDVYDHFDLGEFKQKGSVRTKYGTKEEYLKCIATLHQHKILAIGDIVLNHKQGADETEKIKVQKANPKNRNEFIGEPEEAELYTRYSFPNRAKKYSDYIWDYHSFTGIDQQNGEEYHIYKILNEYGPGWDEVIDDELGNFDYLMGADIELRNPFVREELKKWGRWYYETTKVDGFRLDAVKHMSPSFVVEWIDFMRQQMKQNFFCMAEYWSQKARVLHTYIDKLGGRAQLLDVPLHFNFYEAAKDEKYDLRNLFKGSLLELKPELTITFVDNHDTQPFQTLESPVDAAFKPHAYAVALLRLEGIPCVFFPDYYGTNFQEQGVQVNWSEVPGLRRMMKARKLLAYGEQKDFFNQQQLVGWTRAGLQENPFSGLAILLNRSSYIDNLEMEMGNQHAKKRFRELNGSFNNIIETDEQGKASFPVKPAAVSIWIREEARQWFV